MKNTVRILTLGFIFGFFVLACEKDEKTEPKPSNPVQPVPDPQEAKGTLRVEFVNKVDDQALVLGKEYTSPKGEAYTVAKFNYYISNLVLVKNDNSEIKLKEMYRIVSQSDDTSRVLQLSGIPTGSYKAIKFLLGVDSARNRSGAQTGGLDVAYASDMYWGWTQGYIFLKLEGASPVATSSNKDISYHMGGYGGTYKTQRAFNLSFIGGEAAITETSTPKLLISANVNELFKSPTTISFTEYPTILSAGKNAKMLADNYADMMRFESIQN